MISSPSIPVPELSLYDVLKKTSKENGQKIAYEFLGYEYTYNQFVSQVDDLSLRLKKLGVKMGDKVVICLPNCPQAFISFYAISRLGAVSVMVHPLSSSNEIEFYVEDSGSKVCITMDKFANKFPEIGKTCMEKLIVTRITDTFSPLKRFFAKLFVKEAKPMKVNDPKATMWMDFMKMNISDIDKSMPQVSPDEPASILYTGGTTGRNKGAVHSSRSFNVTSMGMIELSGILGEGDTMLTQMPMFHGFGLCTCVHLPVCIGLRCVIMPNFTLDSLCKTIVDYKVNFIAGVPSMYEKMVDNEYLKNADLSFLRGIFCGGDSMSTESKARFDNFIAEHGCTRKIRIGFGCTECLTATAITPKFEERPGSVGVPIPGMMYKIVQIDTMDEAPDGEYGEMCISGPALMMEYLNNKEETENTLRVHEDGRTWLHTGDLGCIKDGFIYFTNRIKRIIITSGYNVYPSQIEEILGQHPSVESSCVIGVPDRLRGMKVKAVIVLKQGVEPSEETKASISSFVKKNVSSYAKPREYEFVDSLPKTKLAKVDYRALEKREIERLESTSE